MIKSHTQYGRYHSIYSSGSGWFTVSTKSSQVQRAPTRYRDVLLTPWPHHECFGKVRTPTPIDIFSIHCAHSEAHDVFFSAFAALENSCQATLMHHSHAIADMQNLLHIRRDHED